MMKSGIYLNATYFSVEIWLKQIYNFVGTIEKHRQQMVFIYTRIAGDVCEYRGV